MSGGPRLGAVPGAGGAARAGVAFAGIFAVTFCNLLAVGAALPVLPRYVDGPLGGGEVAVGVVIGAYAVTGLLVRPFAGRAADRVGRRPTVVVGALLIAAGGFLYLLPLGVPGLVGARFVLGAGEGTAFAAASAWIVDVAPPQRRGRVIGLFGLSVWAGLSVGPLLGELVNDQLSYTAVWLLAGALPLLGAAIASRVPDPFRPDPSHERHPLLSRHALRPGAALALGAIGYAGLASFVVLHLDQRGIGHGVAAFATFAATVILGRLLAGDLPDRVGPERVAIGAALAEAVGLATLGLAGSLPVALAGSVAIGAGVALLYPALSVLVVDRVPPSARGAALGTYTAFFDLGVGLGAPLVGAVAALGDYEEGFLVAAGLAVCSALLTAADRSRAAISERLSAR